MNYVVAPTEVPVALIANTVDDVFPVHRIYCVGKNYADHIKEMGLDPDKQAPCFFMKPADAIVTSSQITYPPQTENYHYEAELVIAIGTGGKNIPAADALKHVYGYAIGLDMTRRDLQLASSKLGQPWDTGKGFDDSAPLAPIFPVSDVGHFEAASITLAVNGEIRQDADIKQLIWKNHEIIAELSTYYTLQAGDLIFTGTPAGVGAVVKGDRIEARIDGLGSLEVEIV